MNPQNHKQFNDTKFSNYKAILRFILIRLLTIAIFVVIFSRIRIVKPFLNSLLKSEKEGMDIVSHNA